MKIEFCSSMLGGVHDWDKIESYFKLFNLNMVWLCDMRAWGEHFRSLIAQIRILLKLKLCAELGVLNQVLFKKN